MNRLHPDLKRLMIWSSRSLPPETDGAPFGFAARVVAAWNPARTPSLLAQLQQLAWSSAWASAPVILCGAVFLASQAHVPEPVAGLSSALRFLVSNFTR
jgi:hypothetical protein